MPNLVGIGLSQVPTNSMLGGLAYQNPEHASIKDLDLKNLSQINSEIADTATDIFIYDTSKDSDGGAWRKRTSHTSWYNETLGTATRGTRKEFPAVAVIISTTAKVTIYDGDDPNLPMWMVFNAGQGGLADRVLLQYPSYEGFPTAALNGVLVLGQRTSGDNWGNPIVNFISEYIIRADPHSSEGGVFNGGVAQRNDTVGYNFPGRLVITNSRIYDVAMTVQSNAPIDPGSGLPTPTIAIAHKSGLSIITDLNNNIVKNINTDGTVGDGCDFVDFYNGGTNIVTGWDTVGNGTRNTYTYKIPTNATNSASTSSIVNGRYVDPSTASGSMIYYSQDAARVTKVLGLKNNRFILVPNSYNPALTLIDEDVVSSGPDGMSAFIDTDFNTGWMHGKCRLASLSSTSTTNLTNGQTATDRSPNNLHLTVNGTITKTAVATGAELVAYSGFSGSNQLHRPYNASFDPGTGDYSFAIWFKCSPTTGEQTVMRRFSTSSVTGGTLMRIVSSNSKLQWYVRDTSSSAATVNSTRALDDGFWHCAVGTREGSTMKLYIDGKLNASTGCSANSHNPGSNANFVIGAEETVGNAGNYQNPADLCSFALVRYSLSAPDAEQVKRMYNDEKMLFQENAKCTLYGNPASNDLVRALAYDEVTDRYHVATPDGRSDFQGLRRINNTTTAVTTAISAHDEFIVEQ